MFYLVHVKTKKITANLLMSFFFLHFIALHTHKKVYKHTTYGEFTYMYFVKNYVD